ncbi:hypothetical protein OAS86_02220 [Gammaproteobacteria bacterium]|nr:hypothetical protein [Gammaproteobacteria bacterium]
MRCLFILVLLFSSLSSKAVDVLDYSVRYTWPSEKTTVAEIIDYAIEPFGYRLLLATDTAIEIGRQRPGILPQPLKRTSVRHYILSVLPTDGVVFIDTEDQLISFGRFADE